MEDLDYISDSLYRTKIREMHEQLLLRFGKDRSFGADILWSLVEIAVNEIMDHLDRLLDRELLNGSFPQIIGDRCDSVAFFDRESRDRKVRGILSHQGDIGSV